MNAIDDRNQSIKVAFAIAFGYIFHVTSLDKAVKYAKQLSDSYFSGDRDIKMVVGTAIESTFKYAFPEFENVASIFMPLLFIASNDSEQETSTYSKGFGLKPQLVALARSKFIWMRL